MRQVKMVNILLNLFQERESFTVKTKSKNVFDYSQAVFILIDFDIWNIEIQNGSIAVGAVMVLLPQDSNFEVMKRCRVSI